MNISDRPAGKATRMRRAVMFASAALCAAALLFSQRAALSSEAPVAIAPPAVDEPASGAHTQTAVLAGGCFWGVQGVFQHVRGVTRVVSGYSGGEPGTANYDTVSGGRTGHAESVQITYDPGQITYGRLLQVYFSVAHDPTELDRQGPDHGTQYRSAIFAANATQMRVAQSYIAQLDKSRAFPAPIVTKTDSLKAFYPAEGYHQNYLTLHPDSPYIATYDLPKIENLKRMFPDLYREKPVLVTGLAQ
jgi:peptide-methionine (S)-S-oxide reductase